MVFYKYSFHFLILVVVGLWLAVFQLPDANFHLIACDVGEGDALLASSGSIQVLVDGGPDNKVLDCLGKYLPFWDREIELVILTHPEKDHYGGLIEVFKRYQVDNFMFNPLAVSSSDYQVLEKEVGGRGVKSIYPKEGMEVRVGKIYLDILSPSGTLLTDNLKLKTDEPNKFSIVTLLAYGQFRALLTGDMPPEVSDRLAERLALSAKHEWDYLKVPHHGSKNGLTQKLLDAVRPKVAVISVGKNSYGHPHEEILKMLKDKNIKILRTDEIGDVEIESDGTKYYLPTYGAL